LGSPNHNTEIEHRCHLKEWKAVYQFQDSNFGFVFHHLTHHIVEMLPLQILFYSTNMLYDNNSSLMHILILVCYQGIFMENGGVYLETGGGAFDENDFLYPCNKLESK